MNERTGFRIRILLASSGHVVAHPKSLFYLIQSNFMTYSKVTCWIKVVNIGGSIRAIFPVPLRAVYSHVQPLSDPLLSPTLFFFFFVTLVTSPRRSLNLKLSDTGVYDPTRLAPPSPAPRHSHVHLPDRKCRTRQYRHTDSHPLAFL